MAAPTFSLDSATIDGRRVGVHEELAARSPFFQLIHFRRDSIGTDPRLVVVAPLSGQSSAIMRDLLAGLLPNHDLFLIDWLDARNVPAAAGRFGLADNIAAVIEVMRSFSGNTHLLGLSRGSLRGGEVGRHVGARIRRLTRPF